MVLLWVAAPLAACAWCFAGQWVTIGLSCGGAVCCGCAVLGRFGGGHSGLHGGSAWGVLGGFGVGGVVGAAHGLGLVPLVGGLYVSPWA